MATYTTQLQAGQSMIEESRVLLGMWQAGMRREELYALALASGQFTNMSARRLHNLIKEGFAPRFLADGERAASFMKRAMPALATREFEQMLFLYSCRAHQVLHDFVRLVYWPAYAAGRDKISNEEAQRYLLDGIEQGKTQSPWSQESVEHVARALTGACAGFGLLERGPRSVRRILPYRIEARAAAILAYDLHCAGLGDNSLIQHPDWALFGLAPPDALDELKRLALKGLMIVQSAGGVVDIGWHYSSPEELLDVFTQSRL